VTTVGTATTDGVLTLDVDGETVAYDHDEVADLRSVLVRELE
jgi:hypothetical protein